MKGLHNNPAKQINSKYRAEEGQNLQHGHFARVSSRECVQKNNQSK